jgi:heme-degrading monooxygenase HmoA
LVARVSSYEGGANRLEELTRGFEQSGDAVRELDGFEGAYLLVDRSTGNALTVALWSSPDAAEQSAERVNELRREAAEASAHSITAVDVYDVAARIDTS